MTGSGEGASTLIVSVCVLDPKGLLRQLGAPAKNAYRLVYPPGTITGTPNQGTSTSWFTGWNRQPAVISPGPNRNVVTATPQTVWNAAHPDGLFDGDNLVGYRLRRQGNRGD